MYHNIIFVNSKNVSGMSHFRNYIFDHIINIFVKPHLLNDIYPFFFFKYFPPNNYNCIIYFKTFELNGERVKILSQ